MANPYNPNPLPLNFVVEDGSGKPDANSYCDVDFADQYHAGNLYSDNWWNASTDAKQRALVMASLTMDRLMIWNGFTYYVYQGLRWPRVKCPNMQVYDYTLGDAVTQYGQYWPSNYIPSMVKQACAEQAKDLLGGNSTADDPSKGVSALGLGSGAITVQFNPMDRKIAFSDQVMNYLRNFGRIRGARSSVRLVRVQ